MRGDYSGRFTQPLTRYFYLSGYTLTLSAAAAAGFGKDIDRKLNKDGRALFRGVEGQHGGPAARPLLGECMISKVATFHHVYRAEPKESTQFGSVSGSEIQNVPFSHSGIVSLYRSEPKEPT